MTTRPAILLAIALCYTLPLSLCAHPDDASALVDNAWKAWSQGDQAKVESLFRDALRADPDNSRAHIGLSLLYTLQEKEEMAAQEYADALKNQPDRYPYIYSAWITPRIRYGLDDGRSEVIALLKDLTRTSDSLGILRSMSAEALGDYYWGRSDLKEAKKWYAQMNTVQDWSLIGPFDNTSESGYDKAFPPESEFNPTATYEGKKSVPATWFIPPAARLDNWIDLTRYFAQSSAVFYANTFVYSPKKQIVHLRLGTSGSFKLLLNDDVVHSSPEEYNNDQDTYITETTLLEGWNRILVKCGYSENDRCNFLLRITDSHGQPLEGLRVSTDKQQYTSHPGTASRQLGNFAIDFFRARIDANPDHLENYILLADCYLRNDDATNAELILRDALKRAPECVLLHNQLLEAYTRGDKDDEVRITLDKIYALDPNVPSAMDYKFWENIETESYDKAEEIMNRTERMLPNSEKVYQYKIVYFSKKGLSERVVELSHEAYKRFPTNTRFIMTEALLAAQVSQEPKQAISIIERGMDGQYNPTLIQRLADMYLGISNRAKWKELYDQLIEFTPASPGYYYSMSSTYSAMEEYDQAEAMLKKALAICPNSSTIWSALGDVQRKAKKTDDAIASYQQTLLFDPTDYDSRATLREMQGKRSVFEQFPKIDVDSIIRTAPTQEAYAEESAVILLDEAQRVIYPQGASESSQELIVRVFNDRGVDDWKEYYVGYNSYNERLSIDKAVVIKGDKSEVKADIGDNEVIFKSLEAGDIIHLKWRVKSYYSGRLSNQFWDSYYYDAFYPTSHVRYSIIAPKDFTFSYKTQNMPSEPLKKTVEDGVLYSWGLDSLKALNYEYGMPGMGDIGRVLYISSVNDWSYFVDWYLDVAKAKTRSTREVKEQVAELMKGKENASDDEKIRLIYEYITENIRYSSVAFRQGAYIPQKARDVLVNRIGDCKDVATLFISMLSEVGIEAHHVLLNTRDAGMNRTILPSIAFNHCIAAIETKKGTRFFDLTASNYPYGSLPSADLDAFALVIKPGTKGPIYLPTSNTLPRTAIVQTSAQIDDENKLTAQSRSSLQGSLAASIRDAFRHQSKKDQEKKMLEGLSSDYPNVKLVKFDVENLDDLAPEAHYTYSFEAPHYVSESGDFKFMKMPWRYSVSTDEALSYESREYPYDFWPGADTLTEEMEITVPQGYQPVDLPKVVKHDSPVAEYTVKYSFTGGKIIAQRQYINRKSIVETSEYDSYKSFYNKVVKEDGRQILLKKKGKK